MVFLNFRFYCSPLELLLTANHRDLRVSKCICSEPKQTLQIRMLARASLVLRFIIISFIALVFRGFRRFDDYGGPEVKSNHSLVARNAAIVWLWGSRN